MNHDVYPDYYLSDILRATKTIALVGASPNAERPSFRVMAFLLRKGYTVFPVNPGQAGKGNPRPDGLRHACRYSRNRRYGRCVPRRRCASGPGR